MDLPQILFVGLMALGALSGIALWRTDGGPPSDPYAVFRWLPRGRRAAFVHEMRKTPGVASRDLGRALRAAGRDVITSLRERQG